jgi:hypothetical protein
MKLITKEIEEKLPPLYSQENNDNPKIIVKFFTPWSNWSWFVTEGRKEEDGDWLLFGMVHGHEKELGYFTLSELESVRGPGGLKIERDLYFEGKHLEDVR